MCPPGTSNPNIPAKRLHPCRQSMSL
jgi:hypothetical protein